jgi:hypothetical protein
VEDYCRNAVVGVRGLESERADQSVLGVIIYTSSRDMPGETAEWYTLSLPSTGSHVASNHTGQGLQV